MLFRPSPLRHRNSGCDCISQLVLSTYWSRCAAAMAVGRPGEEGAPSPHLLTLPWQPLRRCSGRHPQHPAPSSSESYLRPVTALRKRAPWWPAGWRVVVEPAEEPGCSRGAGRPRIVRVNCPPVQIRPDSERPPLRSDSNSDSAHSPGPYGPDWSRPAAVARPGPSCRAGRQCQDLRLQRG